MKEVYKDDAGRYVEGKDNQRYYEQNCERCGDAYFPKRRGVQKYCSQSCNVRACRERNGYETLDGVQVSKGKAAMLEQMEAIERKIDGLGGKTMGVNTEMLKSTIAGNAIYDAGKAVVNSLFGSDEGKDAKEIKARLAAIEKKINTLQLPVNTPAQNKPQMLPTGEKLKIVSETRILYLEEYSNGKDIVFKLDKQEPHTPKLPRKNNISNI